MKKIILVLILILFFCFPVKSFSAPCYGTKMPKKKQFFVGAQTYWVKRRYLEKEYGKMRSMQHFLLITYGLTDWFTVDLKGGVGNIKQNPSTANEIDYPSWLGGGYGFRIRLYENEKTKAVFGFQHISVHPNSIKVDTVKHKAVLDDWQFSLLVSHSFSKLTPYVGTRWSRMDHIHWQDSNRKRERSDLTRSVGVIAGVDFEISERVWLNLEGSLLDANAVALSINTSF